MKKQITLLVLLGICAWVSSQVPQYLNYQAVARNAQGDALANQSVGIRLIIHDGSGGGTILYSETHTKTTNQFGLFSLEIGTGGNQTGTFSSIDWSTGGKFLEVGIDPAGGSNYATMGNSELMSVPYALYSKGSANLNGTANYVTKFGSASTGVNSQLLDNGTNVGIGTTTPGAKFHIKSAADTLVPNVLVEQDSNNYVITRFKNNSATGFWDLRVDQDHIIFFDGTSRDRIVEIWGSGGSMNVGYDPSGFINAKFKVYSNNYMGTYIRNSTNSSSHYGLFARVIGNSDLYGVYGAPIGNGSGPIYGVYGEINNGGAGSYAGFFSGSVYTTGSYLPSDEKLKENVSGMEHALSLIEKLRPASYQYRTADYPYMNLPEGKQFGFIAGEVEKVFPNAVKETIQPAQRDEITNTELFPEVKFKAINYTQIIPVLVAAMQEQDKTISELKNEVEVLKNELSLLKH